MFAPAHHQKLARDPTRVGTQQNVNDVNKRAFPVAAGAIQDEKGLLSYVSGEAMPERSLQERDEANIVGKHLKKKPLPCQALGVWVVVQV